MPRCYMNGSTQGHDVLIEVESHFEHANSATNVRTQMALGEGMDELADCSCELGWQSQE